MGGAEHARNDDFVRLIERFHEIVFKDSSAACLRARFENGPDSFLRVPLPDGAQCLGNSGRMMCKVIVYANTVDFASQFEPALHTLERRKRVLYDSILKPEFLPGHDDVERVTDIEGPQHRYRECSDFSLALRDL